MGELRIECCAHGGCLSWMQKALVDTEWAISLHLCTNGLRNCPSHLVEASFLAMKADSLDLDRYLLVKSPDY